MRVLDDLVTAGRIRYVGFSNTPAWVTAQANTLAMFRAWTPVIALQVEYSLLARTVEGELMPLALEVTAPIVGARRLEHLEANLASLDVALTDAQTATLDAVSAPQLDYPYDLNRTAGPMLQFAGTTVDGQESVVPPPLLESATRY
jgi:aryl-alcohol dehydrogenase-like predicted oxidoreductase